MYYNTKLKPGLVAFYDMWPGNERVYSQRKQQVREEKSKKK